MSENNNQQSQTLNASSWIILPDDLRSLDKFTILISAASSNFQALKEGDWLLVSDDKQKAFAVSRIYRIHSTLVGITIYFDKFLTLDKPASLNSANYLIRLQVE